jgi:hypothetical protein
MRKKWTVEEKENLALQYKKLNGSIIKTAELFPDRTYVAIKTMLKELCLRTRKLWTEDDILLLRSTFPVLPHKQLEKVFNTNFHNIEIKANSLKIYRTKNHQLQKLLLNSPEAMYWIGFILTDGSIYYNTKKCSMTLGIELSIKDYEQLKKFSNFICCENKISVREREIFGKTHTCCCVRASDYKTLIEICKKFNIVQNKTHNPPNIEILNSISYENILSLFAGIVDGDGSIYKYSIAVEMHKSWEKFLFSLFSKITKGKYEIHISNRKNLVKVAIYRKELLNGIKKELEHLNVPILFRKWNNIAK